MKQPIDVAIRGGLTHLGIIVYQGAADVALLNAVKPLANIGTRHSVRIDVINFGLMEVDRFTRNAKQAIHERGITAGEF